MKRRDTFRLIPLSIAGLAASVNHAFAEPSTCPRCVQNGQPMEPLSVRYLKKARGMLDEIRSTQADKLLEASYAIARTVMRGNVCWYSWDMGHSICADILPGRHGLPELFTVGYDPSKSSKGDLFLASAWETGFDDMVKKDIFVIGSAMPWSQDAKLPELIVRPSAMHQIRPYSKIWIESGLSTIGAIMQVPGMPAPVGPVSGLIGMVTFWMMVADACRIMAREGKSVPVRGDEPPLGKTAAYAGLDSPLMDDYYDEVTRQIEMIGMEMGNIRKIASMVAETVLSGGQVWCYSRYRDALSIEAQTRRGGLALTRGVDEQNGKLVTYEGDFTGTSKDMVIMGTIQPDDERDLVNLGIFRKAGMRVASIGPLTRDIKLPSGRTVCKETDVHVGRMCDTWGLFALPGFERKVCPTSGVLWNQIFWATVMEIMEEMIHRSGGNVPGVFYSAAIKGGTEHMIRMNELWKERGY